MQRFSYQVKVYSTFDTQLEGFWSLLIPTSKTFRQTHAAASRSPDVWCPKQVFAQRGGLARTGGVAGSCHLQGLTMAFPGRPSPMSRCSWANGRAVLWARGGRVPLKHPQGSPQTERETCLSWKEGDGRAAATPLVLPSPRTVASSLLIMAAS